MVQNKKAKIREIINSFKKVNSLINKVQKSVENNDFEKAMNHVGFMDRYQRSERKLLETVNEALSYTYELQLQRTINELAHSKDASDHVLMTELIQISEYIEHMWQFYEKLEALFKHQSDGKLTMKGVAIAVTELAHCDPLNKIANACLNELRNKPQYGDASAYPSTLMGRYLPLLMIEFVIDLKKGILGIINDLDHQSSQSNTVAA